MAKKNVPTTEEPFVPEQLERLENKGDIAVDKQRNKSIFDRFSARRDSKDISRQVRWKRRAGVALVISLLVLLIIFIIAWLFTTIGDLVISVENGAARKGITVSQNADGSDPHLELSAENVTEVTNITYDWLPTNLDTEKDGSHNGRNYLAYTFYLTNNGKDTLNYESTLKIIGVAKSADEAMRVMVYKNGDPTIYAKPNMDKSPLEDRVNFEFVDNEIIFHDTTEDFAPGDTTKYTIVTWIEGNDPECIDDIMGGYTKMQWFFNVEGEEL